MNIKPKDIQVHRFIKGQDSDTAAEILDNFTARYMLNVRILQTGEIGVVTNIKGTVLIDIDLPAGANKGIGHGVDEKNNKFYYFLYNDQGNHTFQMYDALTNSITQIFENLTDTDNVDILHWTADTLILHVDIINGLIYWVDGGQNKARKTNIAKLIDNSPAGYGTIIQEDFINAYKLAPFFAPIPTYFTDTTRNSNGLYGVLCKFAYRYIYDDGEISNFGDYSVVALPENQSYLGVNAITFDNNCIKVSLNTGGRLVVKLELAVKIGSLDWQSVAVLNKEQLGLTDNSSYIYYFYNDGSYGSLDQLKIARAYSFLPKNPQCQAFVKNAMIYTNFPEGFETVAIDASVVVTEEDLYLPPGTINEMNVPGFTVTELSHTGKGGVFTSDYIVTQTHFIIGSDVKKGNVFTMFGRNGLTGGKNADNYLWTYVATSGDDATTVASYFKQQLRSTGRGQSPALHADPNNGIYNESVDMSGNVSWDFWYLGHYHTNKTSFGGSVTPVSFIALQDNGLSIKVIKSGSKRKYAICYDDDDGRSSLGYTEDRLLAKTPFITEVGELKRPIHTITLNSYPPIWARFWRLVRTIDPLNYIQLVIQAVIDVPATTDAGTGEYLDLVIGSLVTYNKVHPNSVLSYAFEKGDRLRLIKDENSGTLYTPYFETEILNYKEVTTELVNAQITTYGTALVKPEDGVRTSYVGKNILITDIERTIVGISGGTQYLLDNIINIGTTTATTLNPNYTFIDRRGLIRIKKPSSVNILALCKVELSKPEKNSDDLQYKNFYDFGMKFDIANWGTPTAYHRGNLQDQDGGQPAIIKVTDGDAYVRNQEFPTNTQVPNTQVVVDNKEDWHFSDFYESDLNNIGRVYPQDDGSGVKQFGSRMRFSNNYIQDTKINGLNDFDNGDREDYNDTYGDFRLTKFHRNTLYALKDKKATWIAILQSIVYDNAGNQTLATTAKLLNQIQYAVWDGGIGNNPESYVINGNYQYYASANSGVFLRISKDGSDAISSIYNFDQKARAILALVSKYNLRIFGGVDRENGEIIWTLPPFILYLFQNGFISEDWLLNANAPPMGTTYVITTQPVNSVATVVGDKIEVAAGTVLGDDFYLYQAVYPDTTMSPIRKKCFTVTQAPNRTTAWRAASFSLFCNQVAGSNSGYEMPSILENFYTDDLSAAGLIKPNIVNIDPQAIIPIANDIYYHETTIAPSGAADGDVWYNLIPDALYKKIAGVWTLLTSKVINLDYIAPVQNLTDCPYTPPAPPSGSSLTANNTTTDFTIAFVQCTGNPNLTTIGPGGSKNETIDPGTYDITVKILPSTDGGSCTLSISANGVVTTYPVSHFGLTQSQSACLAPIIVQIDP